MVTPELVEVTRSGAPISKWQQPFDAALTDLLEVLSPRSSWHRVTPVRRDAANRSWRRQETFRATIYQSFDQIPARFPHR